VAVAAARSGAKFSVSTAVPLPANLGITANVESGEVWLARMANERPERIRLIGQSSEYVAAAVEGDPDVAIYSGAVTNSGRVELLPFLREQSVTVTNHRFGNHDPAFDSLTF